MITGGGLACSRSSSTTATTGSMPRSLSPTGRGRAAVTRSPPTGPASRCAPTAAATGCSCSTTFPDEPGVGADCLVASTDLAYVSTGGSGMTTVASVTHTGYRRRDGGYHSASLPPLELRYSQPVHRQRSPRPEPGGAGEPARRDRRHGLPVGGPGRGGHVRHPGPPGRRLVLQAQPRQRPVRARRGCSPPSPRWPGTAHGRNCSTWPATGTWTWPSSAGPCRAATERTASRRLAAVPPVPVVAEHLLGRPRPAHGRPGRGRPRRRADHRGRRVHLVPVARAWTASATAGGPSPRTRGARSGGRG